MYAFGIALLREFFSPLGGLFEGFGQVGPFLFVLSSCMIDFWVLMRWPIARSVLLEVQNNHQLSKRSEEHPLVSVRSLALITIAIQSIVPEGGHTATHGVYPFPSGALQKCGTHNTPCRCTVHPGDGHSEGNGPDLDRVR